MSRSIVTWLGLFLGTATLPGCLFSNVKTPLDTDVMETHLGAKQGKATVRSVLWLVAWGDGGTKAAAEDGNITVIRHLDSEHMLILFGLYAQSSVVVYGD